MGDSSHQKNETLSQSNLPLQPLSRKKITDDNLTEHKTSTSLPKLSLPSGTRISDKPMGSLAEIVAKFVAKTRSVSPSVKKVKLS